jgi:DNA-binding beta-propeller fold protein YncE
MSDVFGSGEHTYRLDEGWGRVPDKWIYGDCAAIGIDSRDRVYVFNRSVNPLAVFDREGNFLDTWGQGVFRRPHGIHVGPDDTLYCTDDGDHTVRKCTPGGKVLLEIGIPGEPSAPMSGLPFNRCTHTALSPANDIYVSDGYANARVHKYSPDGRHLLSWGGPGCDPGQFNLPHNVCCDEAGWVYVADRENHRIQVFDGEGRYQTQINNLHRPSALHVTRGKCPLCYIGEIGPYMAVNRNTPNLGPRVSIMTTDGKLVSRIGAVPSAGTQPGQFLSPHGIAIDSHGDIYVGEVGFTAWPSLFPGEKAPDRLWCVKKFVRVSEGDAGRHRGTATASTHRP